MTRKTHHHEVVHSSVQSVTRALDLLFTIARSNDPVTPASLASQAELPRPTVYRLADTLVQAGLIARKQSGFVVSPKFFLMSSGGRAVLKLADIVEPHLNHLVQATGDTAGFQVRVGLLRRTLIELEGYKGIRWSHGVGYTAPIWAGAAGHVLMAGMSEPELQRVLSEANVRRLAPGTVLDINALRSKVDAARRSGWSSSVAEVEEGAAAAAAPILLGDRVLGAVNLFAPSDRIEALRGAVPDLLATARAASDEWKRFALPDA